MQKQPRWPTAVLRLLKSWRKQSILGAVLVALCLHRNNVLAARAAVPFVLRHDQALGAEGLMSLSHFLLFLWSWTVSDLLLFRMIYLMNERFDRLAILGALGLWSLQV